MSNTRILLVDDHEVVRLGLKNLIEHHERYEVVAEAATEEEAVQKALEHEPEGVLMDIRLKSGSGITACQRIMERLPETKVIVLTSVAEDDLLFQATRAGAAGYVLKQVGGNELIRGINEVVWGDAELDPSAARTVFDDVRRAVQKEESVAFQELTRQEMEVLSLVAEGKTNREIADVLHLSEGTVRNYVSNILSKLDVSNRAEAAAYAVRHHIKDYLH